MFNNSINKNYLFQLPEKHTMCLRNCPSRINMYNYLDRFRPELSYDQDIHDTVNVFDQGKCTIAQILALLGQNMSLYEIVKAARANDLPKGRKKINKSTKVQYDVLKRLQNEIFTIIMN